MQIPVTDRSYMLVPITGPKGLDVNQLQGSLALVADDGREPGIGDYQPGAWFGQELGVRFDTFGVSAGQYMCWALIVSGQEQVVLQSGRVRVGDTRGTS